MNRLDDGFRLVAGGCPRTVPNDFACDLERLLVREGQRFLATVPYASHLTDPTADLNEAYYLRHRVETIKRIRLTSKVDALALACLVDQDYDAARRWSQYVAEELGHDRLFLRDLMHHGYTPGKASSNRLCRSL